MTVEDIRFIWEKSEKHFVKICFGIFCFLQAPIIFNPKLYNSSIYDFNITLFGVTFPYIAIPWGFFIAIVFPLACSKIILVTKFGNSIEKLDDFQHRLNQTILRYEELDKREQRPSNEIVDIKN